MFDSGKEIMVFVVDFTKDSTSQAKCERGLQVPWIANCSSMPSSLPGRDGGDHIFQLRGHFQAMIRNLMRTSSLEMSKTMKSLGVLAKWYTIHKYIIVNMCINMCILYIYIMNYNIYIYVMYMHGYMYMYIYIYYSMLCMHVFIYIYMHILLDVCLMAQFSCMSYSTAFCMGPGQPAHIAGYQLGSPWRTSRRSRQVWIWGGSSHSG